jgi:hypothetical protein
VKGDERKENFEGNNLRKEPLGGAELQMHKCGISWVRNETRLGNEARKNSEKLQSRSKVLAHLIFASQSIQNTENRIFA